MFPRLEYSSEALRRIAVIPFLLISLILLISPQNVAVAATNELIDATNGASWNTALNWSLNRTPGSNDALLVDTNSPATSGLSNSFTVQTLAFDVGNNNYFVQSQKTDSIATTQRTLTLSGGIDALGNNNLIELSSSTTGTVTIGGVASTGILAISLSASGNIAVLNQSGTLILGPNSVVSGLHSITKTGPGTLVLNGANTYNGVTTIAAGTLLANNTSSATSATGTGSILVNNSGTLGGTGFINTNNNSMAVNGTLLGGTGQSASGTLTIKSAVTMASSSVIELALAGSGAHSTIAMRNSVLNFATIQSFTFIDLGATTGIYDNIITGVTTDPFPNSTFTITNPGWSGTFTWDGANIDLNLIAVPEPGTDLAAALTVLTVAYMLRNRFVRRRVLT